MKYIYLYQAIIYIIIFILAGFLVSSLLLEWKINKCEYNRTHENMRTMPRPTRHPIIEEDNSVEVARNYSSETLNDKVDKFIARFFDENNYPYDNTIDLYLLKCVNQGNVSDQNKKRLNDVAYYFLTTVIPNIPSINKANVLPPDQWPKIEWLSDGWFDYDKGIGLRDAYGNSMSREYSNGSMANSSSINGSNRSNSSGSDSSGNNNGSGNNNPLVNGTKGNNSGKENKCGNDCPTACFANAIQAAKYNEKNNPHYNGPSSNSLSLTDTSSDTTYSNFFSKAFGSSSSGSRPIISGSSGKDSSTTVEGYKITNEPQTSSTNDLDNLITNSIINNWFEPAGFRERFPSSTFKELFTMYTQGNPSIDDFHKNKLRDVVYYVMENIIAGLPTKTNPASYVEWRPIRWLSHSEL